MKYYRSLLVSLAAAFVLGIALWATTPSFAQDQPSPAALPTAPGAERAGEGGLSSAPASLKGPNGASPLEPWLVTWLLPVSGIIAVGFAVYVDRRLRMMDYAGRRARTTPRA